VRRFPARPIFMTNSILDAAQHSLMARRKAICELLIRRPHETAVSRGVGIRLRQSRLAGRGKPN